MNLEAAGGTLFEPQVFAGCREALSASECRSDGRGFDFCPEFRVVTTKWESVDSTVEFLCSMGVGVGVCVCVCVCLCV